MRLTTDTPEQNLFIALNRFFVKDGETWVRKGGEDPERDVTLLEYIRNLSVDLDTGFDTITDDKELAEALFEALVDEFGSVNRLIADFHQAAWTAAELRARLKQYEDTNLTPSDILVLKGTLAEAIFPPCKIGDHLWRVTRDTRPGEPDWKILEYVVKNFRTVGKKHHLMLEVSCLDVPGLNVMRFRDFCETREEAEELLKEKLK